MGDFYDRRGNIEGNTRYRSGSRKDSKKSTNNQESDSVVNTSCTEIP
jgi:hypothetical protein